MRGNPRKSGGKRGKMAWEDMMVIGGKEREREG